MTSDTIAVPAPARSVSLRAERIVPVLVVVVVLVAVVYSITPWPVGVFTDDAIYTILGKALATGEGYRMINLPGAPHGTHYPPGYPLVLSLLWRIWPQFPDNVVLFKFANAVFLAAGAGGVYWFARGRLAMGVAGAAATALEPHRFSCCICRGSCYRNRSSSRSCCRASSSWSGRQRTGRRVMPSWPASCWASWQ